MLPSPSGPPCRWAGVGQTAETCLGSGDAQALVTDRHCGDTSHVELVDAYQPMPSELAARQGRHCSAGPWGIRHVGIEFGFAHLPPRRVLMVANRAAEASAPGSSVLRVLHLVRHASAGDRRAWRGDDSSRPLDPIGHAQAEVIAATLGTAPIGRILSSPSVRCVQTVEPLAVKLGLDVEISMELAEGADGWRTEAMVERLCGEAGDSVLCSHGDVIPDVLWRLAYRGIEVNPARCKKASIWELHVADGAVSHGIYRSPRSLGASLEDLT